MSGAHEEAAGGAHVLKPITHLMRRCLTQQMISAYLCKDRKHVHLCRGDSNVTKDMADAIVDCINTLEKRFDVRGAFGVAAELRVKNWVSSILLVHVVVRAVHVFELLRLRPKVGHTCCEIPCNQGPRLEIRPLETQPPPNNDEEVWGSVRALGDMEHDRSDIEFDHVLGCVVVSENLGRLAR